MTYKIFCILLFLQLATSLKLKIIDEDFVKIRVGNPQTELKLLIDPTSPFSYIFKDFNSKTTEKFESTKFENAFGLYEGHWEEDFFFIQDDPYFNIKLRYVKVTKTQSNLKVDGVFGLGYHAGYPESNIYSVLYKMSSIFKMRKLLSYDKKRKLLTIGEIPFREYSNPVRIPIYQKENEVGNFIKLTSLSYMNKNTRKIEYEDINEDAILGLIPVIIAPKKRNFWMNQTYIPKITENNSPYNFLPIPEKFFTDCHMEKIRDDIWTDVVINKTAYRYKFAEKKNGFYRATIRLGDDVKNPLPYWYLGVDALNIDRLDFDYNIYVVRIFSSSAYDIDGNKLLFLFKYIILTISICCWLTVLLRVFLAKKKKKDIPEGQELEEL